MSITRHYRISLNLEGPLLTHGGGGKAFGLDATMLRYHGVPVINGSEVRGNLRHALEYFAGLLKSRSKGADTVRPVTGSDIRRWFGQDPRRDRPADMAPQRAALDFDFFWRLVEGEERYLDSNYRNRNRIKIDQATQLTETGSLHVTEDRFGTGERVHLSGRVIARFEDAREADHCTHWLRKALHYLPAIGALKSVGFGRVLEGYLHIEDAPSPAPIPEIPDDPRRLGLILTLDRPFCVGKPRTPDSNRIVSEECISGNVLKGVLARRLDDATKTELKFDDLVFRHALPAPVGKPVRQAPIPLSAAVFETEVRDLALQKEPCLLKKTDGDVREPLFRPDWKGKHYKLIESAFLGEDNKKPDRYLSVRTAINPEKGVAEESQLFSHECVDPAGFVWCSEIDLSAIEDKDERCQIFDKLTVLLATGFDGIGKTKARATVAFRPEGFSNGTVGGVENDTYVVRLVTPARLLPDDLNVHGCNGDEQLREFYANYWRSESGGAFKLSHYFARQTLAGGEFHQKYYRKHSKSGKKGYRPDWLTEAGSVFVLQVVDLEAAKAKACLDRWRQRGLGVTYDRKDDNWQSDPFLPENGFGEVLIQAASQLSHCAAGEGFEYVPVF